MNESKTWTAAVLGMAIVIAGACDITIPDDSGNGLTAGAATEGPADDDGMNPPPGDGDGVSDSDSGGGPGPGPGATSGITAGSDGGTLPPVGDDDGMGTTGGGAESDSFGDTEPFGETEPFEGTFGWDTEGFGTFGEFDTDGFGTGVGEFCDYLEDQKTCEFFDEECVWDVVAASCSTL